MILVVAARQASTREERETFQPRSCWVQLNLGTTLNVTTAPPGIHLRKKGCGLRVSMFRPLLVKTTFTSKADAEKMAMTLLNQGLTACAQISGPTQSFYWWKGKIETQEEYVLVLKSEASLYNTLEQEIKKNHPYDLPEIIGTEISRISGEYRTWMEGELDLD